MKVKAIALSRETDMYQFQEHSHSRETKDSFGAVTRTTVRSWLDGPSRLLVPLRSSSASPSSAPMTRFLV